MRHGAPGPGWNVCYSCHLTCQQVSEPTRLVVPISLYCIGGQLHHVLRNYKSGYPVGGSVFHPGGTTLIVHADPDDEKTDPAGNSGARVACGVVQR